jgi:DtxR family transcriptional regulator, manganese transport regulator
VKSPDKARTTNATDEDDSNRLESIRSVRRNITARTGPKSLHTDTMEDYLEVIYELIERKGYATTIDISNYLNVSSPSVTKMVQKLDEEGHVRYEKYRGITLTKEGVAIAKGIRNRHSLLVEFLRIIGVNEGIANMDAEGLEHHMHPETLQKLEEFIKSTKK